MHETRQPIITAILLAVSFLQPLGCSPPQQVSQSQAGKTTKSEVSKIRITPYNPQQGTVLAEYLDDRTGRTLTVKGDVSQDTAVAWLTQLADTAATKSEQDLAALVTAGQAKGLLSVSSVIGDTSITVSWGPPPKRDPPPGMIVFSIQDRRSGDALVISKAITEDATKAWFAAAAAARTGEQFVALVEAHRSEGLQAVSGHRMKGRVRVTAFWSPAAEPR